MSGDDTQVTSAQTPSVHRPPPTPSPCPGCGLLNPISNEYCAGCGAPMVTVTEVAQIGSLDTPRALNNWRVYGVQTSMFGRQAAFDQLTSAINKAFESSSCQVITLAGPDGIGKSRLVAELNEQLDNLFDNTHLVAGSCQELSSNPYAPFARLIKNRFYIPKMDQGEMGRLKLTQGIKAIIRNPLSSEIAQLIGYLIGMPFPDCAVYERHGHDPTRILEHARSALTRLIERDAERQPLILVIEELHRIGDESLALIKHMHQSLDASPVVIICVTQPEFKVRAPWLFEETHERTHLIHLRQLADDQISALVHDILRRLEEVPKALIELICERAFGNPLSVEGIIRVLISNEVIDTRGNTWTLDLEKLNDVELPSSFEGLIQARLNGLTDEERALVEKASVVGQVFWDGALRMLDRSVRTPDLSILTPKTENTDEETVWPGLDGLDQGERLGELLEVLQRKDIIDLRDGDSSIPDAREYVFRHAIERKLIYEALVPERRNRYHTHVAQWLSRALSDEQRDQFIDLLAQHYELGGNLHQAALCHHEAGRLAASRYHGSTAISHFEQALTFLGESDLEQRIDVLHDISTALEVTGEAERNIQYLTKLLGSAWVLGDPHKIALGYIKLVRAHTSLGHYNISRPLIERALKLFRELDDQSGIAACLDELGRFHTLVGAYDEAVEQNNLALTIRRELGDPRAEALTLHRLGGVQLLRGEFKDALRRFRESLVLRKKVGDRRGVAETLNSLAALCHERGDLDQAASLYAEVEEAARAIGDRVLLGIALNNRGELSLVQGDLEKARACLDETVRLTRETGERRILFDALKNLGQLHRKLDNYDKAISLTRDALQLAEQLGAKALIGIAQRSLGELYASTLFDEQNIKRAETCFRQAIQILTEVGNGAEQGRTLSSYGNYLLEQGQMIQGRKHLEMAKEIFARLEMKRVLEKTERTIDEL